VPEVPAAGDIRASVGGSVGATAGVGVGAVVGPMVGAVDALLVGVAVEQVERVIESLIRVTSPLRASALPFIETPLAIVIDVSARMVPTKVEPEPRVAELVTCQKTLQAWPPLMNVTVLDDAVTRSEARKIQTAFGSFWPSSVSVPVRPSVTPGQSPAGARPSTAFARPLPPDRGAPISWWRWQRAS